MVTRHEFLTAVHTHLQPAAYLEIGVNTGRSLTLSRSRTIAVDPAFKIKEEIACDLRLVKSTSDDFFARPDALAHFGGRPPSLAFLDGLHLFDFVLRDVMNVERVAAWSTVLVVDDILPRSAEEASRDRGTMGAWTGDVYKIVDVLRRLRPDLLLLPLDTEPTGVLVILGADPGNETLAASYEQLVAELVHPDPQPVPADVLARRTALDPGPFLGPQPWRLLATAQREGLPRDRCWQELSEQVAALSRPAPPGLRTAAERRRRPVPPTHSAGTEPPARRAAKAAGRRTGHPGVATALTRRSRRMVGRVATGVRGIIGRSR